MNSSSKEKTIVIKHHFSVQNQAHFVLVSQFEIFLMR